MSIDFHVVELVPGTVTSFGDRLLVGVQATIANAAGGSAGAAVTTNVSFGAGGLPPNYAVVASSAQDATVAVTNKTASGFSVTLTPRLATMTLAASTFDVIVLG